MIKLGRNPLLRTTAPSLNESPHCHFIGGTSASDPWRTSPSRLFDTRLFSIAFSVTTGPKENSVSTAATPQMPPVTPRPQSNKEGPVSRQAMQHHASTSASGQTKKVSGTFDRQVPPPANAKVNSIGNCLKARVRLQLDPAAGFVLVTCESLASFSRNGPKITASFASVSWPRQPQPRGRTNASSRSY